jgi:hypothetical protein
MAGEMNEISAAAQLLGHFFISQHTSDCFDSDKDCTHFISEAVYLL